MKIAYQSKRTRKITHSGHSKSILNCIERLEPNSTLSI